jgi:hypothetical protein
MSLIPYSVIKMAVETTTAFVRKEVTMYELFLDLNLDLRL